MKNVTLYETVLFVEYELLVLAWRYGNATPFTYFVRRVTKSRGKVLQH